MYIPKINQATDRDEVLAFMQRFSFATIVTAKDNLPVATHLPFVVTTSGEEIILFSHFRDKKTFWDCRSQNVFLSLFASILDTRTGSLGFAPASAWQAISRHQLHFG